MTSKDYSKENKKRMLVALAVLLGFTDKNDTSELAKLTAKQTYELERAYVQRGLKQTVETPERMPERQMQIQVAEKGIDDNIDVCKIVGSDDDKTCPDCKRMQGQLVTMNDNSIGLPTVQDFINSHLFHPNCRCSLQECSVDEIPLKSKSNPRYEERKNARPDIYNCVPMSTIAFS